MKDVRILVYNGILEEEKEEADPFTWDKIITHPSFPLRRNKGFILYQPPARYIHIPHEIVL